MAFMVMEPHYDQVCILQAYSEDAKVSTSLFKYACKWSKRKGFEKIYGYVSRHPRAWKRKYDMDIIGYKIGKELI